MCGILGEWRRQAEAHSEARFETALGQLAHRGPDDLGRYVDRRPDGVLVLGHRRLSIIDLTAGGHQPMHSRDGQYVIVFNGEIYNYRELRQELRAAGDRFDTDSDTEVLLAAWAHWGAACLPRLIGMFAFVVYDRSEGTLVAVRDAFGIKPFFYAHDASSFVFGSELAAVLTLRASPPVLNRQRAYDYLVHGIQDAAHDSFINGIRHLPPAHWLRIDLVRGTSALERWWQPDIDERKNIGFADAADAVRELFLDSVRLHLRSDVAVGAALSGGIDSSALVCAARHVEPSIPINTFSFIAGDARLSEEPWVDLVNAHAGAIPHKVFVEEQALTRDLGDLIRTQGEPFCTTSMYAQYCVFRAARECGVTVVLEGQGADELLGGYDGYPGQRMLSLLERGRIAELAPFAARWRTWPGRSGRSAWSALLGQLLPDDVYKIGLAFIGIDTSPSWLDLAALRGEGAATRPPRVRRSGQKKGRRVAEVLAHALTDTYLPSLLRYGDRNAMRFSIENRVPFLTVPLADLLLSLPEAYLVSPAGETKHIFRAALRGIVPDPVLARRDKVGFETPMRAWLRTLAPTVSELLRETKQFAFLAPDKMLAAFNASMAGAGSEAPIWRLINLCWWSRMYAVS